MSNSNISQTEIHQNQWQLNQTLAESILPLLGRLYREKGVEVLLFGKTLVNATTIDIIKTHRVSRHYSSTPVSISQTAPIIERLIELDLSPCCIDVGQLATQYWSQNESHQNIDDFLMTALNESIESNGSLEARDVVLYGFGRIGRLLTRILVEKSGSGYPLRLRAIVVRGGRDGDLQKRASLLRRDSVHGQFNGSILVDEDNKA